MSIDTGASINYEPLAMSSHRTDGRSKRNISRGGIATWLLAATLAVLNIAALLPILYEQAGYLSISGKPCGSDWRQAEHNRCYWDLMSMSWVPTDCFDDELANEFEGLADWKLWTNANRTNPLTPTAASQHLKLLNVSPEFMQAFCIFSNKRYKRAMQRGHKVPQELANMEFAEQCQHFLMGTVPNPNGKGFESTKDSQIWFGVRFPRCVRLRSSLGS